MVRKPLRKLVPSNRTVEEVDTFTPNESNPNRIDVGDTVRFIFRGVLLRGVVNRIEHVHDQNLYCAAGAHLFYVNLKDGKAHRCHLYASEIVLVE